MAAFASVGLLAYQKNLSWNIKFILIIALILTLAQRLYYFNIAQRICIGSGIYRLLWPVYGWGRKRWRLSQR